MPQWTYDQQQAIDARNGDLLVSAAAGSGKTAVLVERIVELARQGHRLDRMLIVTFTRAAAGEMRERIQARLSREADAGDEKMHRQLALMDNCQISTLHGFCQKVLREHFEAVGLDPQTRLCDPALQDRLYEDSAQAAMLDMFEQEDPDFDHLAHCFEQPDILTMMKELYTFLMSLEDPWGWLARHTPTPGGDLSGHLWTVTLLKDLCLQLEGMEPLLTEMERLLKSPHAVDGYDKLLAADQFTCRSLMDTAHRGMEALAAGLDSLSWQRAPVKRGLLGDQAQWVEDYKALRESLKKICQDVKKQAIPSLDAAARDMDAMDPSRRGLAKAVKNLELFFAKAKSDLGVMDFNDLEHLTLKILKDPAARQLLSHSYDHLFIDEYQDVSQIQEAIVQALHHENNLLFMVGDVKQSIYRFRLADPSLFLTKQETFDKDPSAARRKIVLQKNFRSQPGVLHGVNQVFGHVMRREITEIDYDEDARLVPGREESGEDCVSLEIVVKPEETEEIPAEYLACARLIHEAMAKPLPDPSAEGGRRPCRWRDIAVLMPKTRGFGSQLAQALKDQGIPVYLEGDEDYFDLPEIHTVMETLKVVDNPLQDLPLLTALSLPCFHLSHEELALIRLEDQRKDLPYYEAFRKACLREDELGEKCRFARDTFNEWRFLKDALPLDGLIWKLLGDSGVYRQAGALPGGENRQGNLRFLCQRAADFTASQGGALADFIREGESLRASQDKTTAKLLGEGENLVRIMTIHKSKGLEFPVTLVVGLGQNLHLPAKGKLRLHKELGFGLAYVNPEDRITRPTLAMTAISLRKRMEEKAERARLLYVAMTRAREKLILVGMVKAYPLPLWRLPASAYGVYAAGTMMDWVCQSLWKTEAFPGVQSTISPQFTSYPQGQMPWKIRVWEDVIHTCVDNSATFHKALSHLENQFTSPVDEAVAGRLARASEPAPPALPLKTSVSSLCRPGSLPLWLDAQPEEDREDKAAPQWTVAPLTMSPLPEKPAFLQEETPGLTGAQRGTAAHQALSLLDYARLPMENGKKLYHSVQLQLEEMASAQALTLLQRESVRADWLCRFLESDLGMRARRAGELHREWAFNYRLPGAGRTLVQGVIDLCFIEDGEWILADYKTDYYEDPQLLRERYTPQLLLYRQALEAITGRRVRQVWLYGLRRGDALLIEPKENDQ